MSRHRPLLLRGSTLYASAGLALFASEDSGRSFSFVAGCGQLGGTRRLASGVPFLARVGRLGFHALRILPSKAMVAVVRGHIVRRSESGGDFHPVFRLPRGSRPLNLCLDGQQRLYFGEYFSNPDRDAVHVYGSADGATWEPVHTFPPGSIRHVHGIVHDPIREGVWVLTGDDDAESALWFTGDGFRTLERVVSGSQRTRAVSVIPTERGLVVPSDSPRIRNWIQILELPEGRLKRICRLPGSAFHAVKSGSVYLVSTVSEPRSDNDVLAATLYASSDAEDWGRVSSLPGDLWSRVFPFARRLLRYPEIALTPGSNTTPYVFGFGRSLRGAGGRLLRWPQGAVLDAAHGHGS